MSALLGFYAWRLRRHGVQELLAGLGIAVGVALTFGVLLANTAINGSASELDRQLIGSAKLQLVARSSAGFSEQIAEAAGRLPGVEVASPLLRSSAVVVGPRGRQLVQLIGVTASLAALEAQATQNLGAGTSLLTGGIGLAEAPAQAAGVHGGQRVLLLANGEAHRVLLRLTLGSQIVGAVAGSPIAIALLPVAQHLVGTPGRVTNVLIKPAAGAQRQVEGELRRLAAGRLDVVPANNDLRLLAVAAGPTNQSTTLFAAISAMVGFLLALNAMLLSVPERRRFVTELRLGGFDPAQVILVLVSQALALGLLASAAGIVVGDILAHTLFHQIPSYITFAFPVGSEQAVHLKVVLLAVGCGVLAALVASLIPALDLREDRALDNVLREPGEPGQNITKRVALWLGLAGLALLVAVTTIVIALPSLTVIGGILLALAAVCFIPSTFALALKAIAPFSERARGMLGLAVVELRAGATRSIALAAIAALAVYGSIAIQGTRNDLDQGLNKAIVQYLGTAEIWVTTGDNVFTTDSFNAGNAVHLLARSPGIASVRIYQGGLLDVGSRRLWIRARPPGDSEVLQPSQMLEGNFVHASSLIRRGGWAAVSNGFASEHHLRVGSPFTLPTPSGGAPLHIAAITTNTGWPSGAITLSSVDYGHYWQTAAPAALEINLRASVSNAEGRRIVRAALGNRPGLWIQIRSSREAQFKANVSQGLRSLGQISTLLLVSAALAIALALGAALWQRRVRFAALKTQGYDERQLWRSLLLESTIVLVVGCADGFLLGIYGHAIASRWLRLTTGFPASFTVGLPQMLINLAILSIIALTVVAIPGFSAARVAPRVGFQE
ncbi:MAG TPA: FtsX-like permease family protein [Solirubrobacteraceae bacterium]|nr:FtsX-like permease family protein [Solirubrobacteraceae bacterium]